MSDLLDDQEIATLKREVSDAAWPLTMLALMWLLNNPEGR